MLELTPRIYGQNMTWKIAPTNIIDTVYSTPILNTLTMNIESLKTLTYSEAFISSQNKTYALPMNEYTAAGTPFGKTSYSSVNALYIHIAKNVDSNGNVHAAGRTEFLLGSIEDEITLDSPLYGTPTIDVQLHGNSYYRQATTEISSFANDAEEYKRITNVIPDNSKPLWYVPAVVNGDEVLPWLDYEENTLHFSYSDNYFSCTPFISTQGIYTGRVTNSKSDDRQEADYLSAWIGDILSSSPITDNWISATYTESIESIKNDSDCKLFYPYNYESIDTTQYPNTPARLFEDKQQIKATLTDTEDPLKKILKVEFPVYIGGSYQSRYGVSPTPFIQVTDIADFISSITVTILGRTFSTDTVDKGYSLDAENNLVTEPLKNKYSHKISKNELITVNTKVGDEIWDKAISKTLLNKYVKGKYVVKAKVPAKWALLNNVHINTQMQIKTLENEYISRSGSICTFEVKTITKHYESSTFYYELQLMEI